jgi:uncharacterized phage protein gp47/JayE
MATLCFQPFAGNVEAYKLKVLSIPGVGAVQVWPVGDGPGTVVISVLNNEKLPAEPGFVEFVQNEICPIDPITLDPSDQGTGFAPIGAKVRVMTAEVVEVHIAGTVTPMVGFSVLTLKPQIENALKALIAEVVSGWGSPFPSTVVNYQQILYAARVVSAIVSVPGVATIKNLTINGTPYLDFVAEQSVAKQEIIVFGSFTHV